MSGKHFHLELLNFEPSEYITFSKTKWIKCKLRKEGEGRGRMGECGRNLEVRG